MASNKESASTVAKQNLKSAWDNPVTKIGLLVGVLVVIVMAGAAIAMLRGGGKGAGAAQGDGYNVSGGEPRGAVDQATARAVEANADRAFAEAKDAGQSFGGPFVYEGAPSDSRRGGVVTGFDETGAASGSSAQVTAAMTNLRAKAADYDAADEARGGGSAVASSGGSRGTGQGGASRSSAQQGVSQGYGLSPEAFGQIAGQLASVGTGQVRYESLPNGILSKPPQAPVQAQQGSVGGGGPVAKTSSEPREEIAARAGQICGAVPDTAINTDYNVPVFFEILECGVLTGAKAKGVVAKSPDDFTIRFTSLSLDPKKGYKLVAQVEGMAVSVKDDGSPGVAENVDNHWGTRLASSALLALARTERSFIGARGSTSVNTGNSSTVSIDPLTSQEKRDARLAGLVEGTMDVVSKDVSLGVNRPATMTLSKSALIGIQFMSDVKVVPNE